MKLLNRSIRSYIIYSIIVILVAVPVFYFVIQAIVHEEIDEGLIAQKEEAIQRFKKLTDSVYLDESVAQGMGLIPVTQLSQKDSFFNTTTFDKISHENIPYRVIEFGLTMGGKPFSFQLKRSLVDNEDLIQSIVTVMIILMILIVAGFLIINRLISKNIWQPFYSTVNTLNQYDLEKNETPQFDKTNIVEFSDLNKSISALIERNNSVFQSQKEFTENAAHEMQTPLAILQGKLELLMQTEPINTDQAGLISDLADASQRMNRLNRSLLLLTKIENKQFIEKESISIDETVEKMISQYSWMGEQKNISFQKQSSNGLTIDANRTLLEILVSNLVTNAIRHSPDRGIIVTEGIDKGELIIKNTAKNGPLDHSKIFQRFEKESTDTSSTGLGLAIVSKICSIYNYNIQYSFAGNMHVFSVKF
jgi:signal transduction histidine kinase